MLKTSCPCLHTLRCKIIGCFESYFWRCCTFVFSFFVFRFLFFVFCFSFFVFRFSFFVFVFVFVFFFLAQNNEREKKKRKKSSDERIKERKNERTKERKYDELIMASFVKGVIKVAKTVQSAVEIPQLKAQRDKKKEDLRLIDEKLEEVQKMQTMKTIVENFSTKYDEILSNSMVSDSFPLQVCDIKTSIDKLFDEISTCSTNSTYEDLLNEKQTLENEIEEIQKNLDKARNELKKEK